MTDQPPPPLPQIEAPRASIWRNLSVVWLVPVLALVVALGVAWQSYAERGTLIEIRFESAGGVIAGETTVRYRDVVIGMVETVRFTSDLQTVLVAARVETQVLPYMDDDATFWVVRPEISAQGISGLSTVVSGVFIQGAWDSDPEFALRSFEGRETPLLVLPGEEGRRITLRVGPDMQLQGGAPVFFRGVQVGRLEQPELIDDGSALIVDAFISAPHDQQLSQATRFWDISGFSVSFGAGGLSLDVESLAALVSGGIEFDAVFTGGEPVGDDFVFDIYDSEDTARESAFSISALGDVPVSVEFSGFVSGLSLGTRVDLLGVQVGEVTAIRVRTFATDQGPKQRLVVDLTLDPGRMGLPRDADAEAVYDFLADAVAGGLRVQLASAGLLTAALRVELVTPPDPPRARFDRTAEPYPILPSLPVDLSDLNTTAEGLLERIGSLPFETLLNQAVDTLQSIEALAADPALRTIPTEAATLLAEARGVLTGTDMQAIPSEARAALDDLTAILTELRNGGAIAAITGAAQQADVAMGPITEASAQLPEIMANLRALSETATELELEALVASANGFLGSADALISSDGMADVPAALSGALAELRGLLADLSAADVTTNLNATLTSARAAADGLPALVAQTEAVLDRANTLIAAYGDRSPFMTETNDVLREISAAARAIAQLARTIERNPSSLITGR
jgi:paraquat-inducible protein B